MIHLTLKRCRKLGFDYTTNAPQVLAHMLGITPREAAYRLVRRLRQDPAFTAMVAELEYWEPRG